MLGKPLYNHAARLRFFTLLTLRYSIRPASSRTALSDEDWAVLARFDANNDGHMDANVSEVATTC